MSVTPPPPGRPDEPLRRRRSAAARPEPGRDDSSWADIMGVHGTWDGDPATAPPSGLATATVGQGMGPDGPAPFGPGRDRDWSQLPGGEGEARHGTAEGTGEHSATGLRRSHRRRAADDRPWPGAAGDPVPGAGPARRGAPGAPGSPGLLPGAGPAPTPVQAPGHVPFMPPAGAVTPSEPSAATAPPVSTEPGARGSTQAPGSAPGAPAGFGTTPGGTVPGGTLAEPESRLRSRRAASGRHRPEPETPAEPAGTSWTGPSGSAVTGPYTASNSLQGISPYLQEGLYSGSSDVPGSHGSSGLTGSAGPSDASPVLGGAAEDGRSAAEPSRSGRVSRSQRRAEARVRAEREQPEGTPPGEAWANPPTGGLRPWWSAARAALGSTGAMPLVPPAAPAGSGSAGAPDAVPSGSMPSGPSLSPSTGTEPGPASPAPRLRRRLHAAAEAVERTEPGEGRSAAASGPPTVAVPAEPPSTAAAAPPAAAASSGPPAAGAPSGQPVSGPPSGRMGFGRITRTREAWAPPPAAAAPQDFGTELGRRRSEPGSGPGATGYSNPTPASASPSAPAPALPPTAPTGMPPAGERSAAPVGRDPVPGSGAPARPGSSGPSSAAQDRGTARADTQAGQNTARQVAVRAVALDRWTDPGGLSLAQEEDEGSSTATRSGHRTGLIGLTGRFGRSSRPEADRTGPDRTGPDPSGFDRTGADRTGAERRSFPLPEPGFAASPGQAHRAAPPSGQHGPLNRPGSAPAPGGRGVADPGHDTRPQPAVPPSGPVPTTQPRSTGEGGSLDSVAGLDRTKRGKRRGGLPTPAQGVGRMPSDPGPAAAGPPAPTDPGRVAGAPRGMSGGDPFPGPHGAGPGRGRPTNGSPVNGSANDSAPNHGFTAPGTSDRSATNRGRAEHRAGEQGTAGRRPGSGTPGDGVFPEVGSPSPSAPAGRPEDPADDPWPQRAQAGDASASQSPARRRLGFGRSRKPVAAPAPNGPSTPPGISGSRHGAAPPSSVAGTAADGPGTMPVPAWDPRELAAREVPAGDPAPGPDSGPGSSAPVGRRSRRAAAGSHVEPAARVGGDEPTGLVAAPGRDDGSARAEAPARDGLDRPSGRDQRALLEGQGGLDQQAGTGRPGGLDGQEPDPEVEAEPAPAVGRAGRNLPAAIGVGVALGALVVASLAVRKEAFVGVVCVAVVVAVWELASALSVKRIVIPVIPVAVGSLGMLVSAFVAGEEGLLVSFTLTAFGALLWRIIDGVEGAVTDVAAAVFTAAYVPFLAGFAMLMLAAPDGARRIVVFITVTISSDIGGYVAGVLFGKHRMAPLVSPKKSWEGFAGSSITCMAVGVAGVVLLLHGRWWVGLAVGAAAVVTATVGDLSESLLKRDLGIKDMGRLLPGHGGMMDRLDSLLPTAPAVFLLLALLVRAA